MQINPMRPNPYRPATQQRQPLPKFGGGNQKLTPQEMDHIRLVSDFQKGMLGTNSEDVDSPSNWKIYDTALAGLQETFKNKEKYSDEHQKALSTLQEQDKKVAEKYLEREKDLLSSINAPQSAASPDEVPPAAASSEAKDENGKSSTPASSSEKPTWTPKEERTKTKVLMDVTSHYFTRGKVVSDLLWSVGIGAVCAIGSPVMAVTIPTTMAVFGGLRLLQLAAKWFKNPKGDDIDKMYQKWTEADEAKAKKAEGKSS